MTILITLGDIQINRVKQTKHLGVYPEENLKWAQHIDKVGSNVSRSISSLRQAWDFVSQDVLTTIYSSLIQPVFDYCDAVWGNLNKGLANKIKKLQNRAARIITSQGYEMRSVDLLEFVNWGHLAMRKDKRLCLLMYDVINRI